MAKGFKSGVSSLPAGLKIVGNPRPSFPKEGNVWVNTDTEITGYVLSATQPENPTAGMLWIKISDSSSIKVGTPLGKDYITIMLNNVSQYVDGAWVSVEAMSFQNGVWVDWITYIIKNGVISSKFELVTIRTVNPFALEQHDDYLRMYDTDGGSNGYGISKGVDVTDISKIILVCKIINPGDVSNGGCGVGLAKTVNANLDYNASIANIVASEMRTVAGSYVLELKVESYSGVYYPCIWARSIEASKADIYVYDFYYV